MFLKILAAALGTGFLFSPDPYLFGFGALLWFYAGFHWFLKKER